MGTWRWEPKGWEPESEFKFPPRLSPPRGPSPGGTGTVAGNAKGHRNRMDRGPEWHAASSTRGISWGMRALPRGWELEGVGT